MPQNERELEDRLSEPSSEVIDTFAQLSGDVVFLGVAGKMGPSLARMARRATDAAGTDRRIYGVSRFTSGGEDELRSYGVEPICCDLLDETAVMGLPDAANVVYMPGRKFGSTGDESTTWAVNCYLPSLVCKRYRGSRIVAFSTGNVYPLVPVSSGGSKESDALNPVGEYGMSALGRERMFGYFSRRDAIPCAILRLNYACDLRYGVLVDLAKKVLVGEPVDLSMGYFNTIWQGDANALTLRAFDFVETPPRVFNLTGRRVLAVREVCQRYGELFGVEPRFTGTESETALLSDSGMSLATLGEPRIGESELIAWVADWVKRGGRSLGKPTHFEARDGKF